MPSKVRGARPRINEMTADTGKIGGRWPAPKSGTNTMCQQYGKQYCKGICGGLSNKGKRGKKPYLTHIYCSRCGANGVWILREDAPKNRCPCCKMKVRSKSFKQNSGKYNTVVELG